jgi:hypothetical protein
MQNRTGYLRPCSFKIKLPCKFKPTQCPLQDPDFIRDLERFLYQGRTPRSVSIDNAVYSQNGFKNDRSHFLAINALVFGADFILSYDKYVRTGKLQMSRSLCRNWRQAYSKWKTYLKYRDR